MTYSMLPKDSLDHIKAKVTIGNTTDTRMFTFETKILSFETSKDEAVKMGQYMCLHDSQIKPFKQGNLLRGIVNWMGATPICGTSTKTVPLTSVGNKFSFIST